MKTPNFKSEDHELQHIFDVANSLSVGDKFDYVGMIFTITGFTTASIVAEDESKNKRKFRALDFEDRIRRSFVRLIK